MFVKISNEKSLQSVCVQFFSEYVSWSSLLKRLRGQQPSVQQKTDLLQRLAADAKRVRF